MSDEQIQINDMLTESLQNVMTAFQQIHDNFIVLDRVIDQLNKRLNIQEEAMEDLLTETSGEE